MYKFLPDKLNVMFSAGGFWDNEKKEWRRGAKFKPFFGLRWLDCGGFTILNQYMDYPFSTVNLANLIARLKPDFYVPKDYPCEPEISRSLGLMSNKERIEATVDSALKLAEWEGQLKGVMIPVIQGYSLDEYLHCLELYNSRGLIRDYMAVGSMCRRISNDELKKLIPGVYQAASNLGCQKLHFFGLELSKKLEPFRDMIYSRDSAAIFFGDKKWQGRRFPRGQKEKKEGFDLFLGRLREMNFTYTN